MTTTFSAFYFKLEPVSCHMLCQAFTKSQIATNESQAIKWSFWMWSSEEDRRLSEQTVCQKSKALAAWYVQEGIRTMSLQEVCFHSCGEYLTSAS